MLEVDRFLKFSCRNLHIWWKTFCQTLEKLQKKQHFSLLLYNSQIRQSCKLPLKAGLQTLDNQAAPDAARRAQLRKDCDL